MATIYASASATARAPSARSPVALITGLAALGIGFAMLLGAAVQPNSESHSVMVRAEAANRPATGQDAVGQDTARANEDWRLLRASRAIAFAGRRGVPITMHDPFEAEQVGPVRPDADSHMRTAAPSGCLESELARGARAESAQLATIPLRE